jgi:hypothetical protein
MQTAIDESPSLSPRRLSVTMITFVASLSAPVSGLGEAAREVAAGRGGIFRLASNAPLVAGPSSAPKSLMFRDSMSPCATTQVFASGKVQVAGCSSHIQFAALMEALLELLDQELHVEDFDTHLVNINVGLGVGVRIGLLPSGDHFVDLLNGALAPLDARRRAEKRENFAPVTIVLPAGSSGRAVTCQLFASGSMQISGPTITDVGDACAYVMRFLHRHAENVLVPLAGAKAIGEDRAKTSRCWTELAKVAAPSLCHTHLPVRRLVPGCAYCALYGNSLSV